MKHFGGRNKLIEKTKNRENIPSLDKVEEVLVQCSLIGNQQYQQKSEVLYT